MSFIRRLFRQKESSPSETPFPTQQLFILALVRLCEPIAFMSIFPYIYYMIESFNITKSSTEIAVYAGMVTSAFALAEFTTSPIWGKLSDRVGRKPVLLGGLAGTALSMIMFGVSTNLPMALLARSLGGFLNGNIGVLQTVVAELITDKKQQPRGYSIMPFIWCLGSFLGPALGGTLAQPVKNYPSLFSETSIFATYPFLLSNLVCVAILCCGLVIGFLFLKETHADHKHKRDSGVEIGKSLVAMFSPSEDSVCSEKSYGVASNEEFDRLLPNTSQPQQPLSTFKWNTLTSASGWSVTIKSMASTEAFTHSVVMNIVAFAIIAYHGISFDQMMPIFLSSPVTDEPAESLFKFTGGFGFSSTTVGTMNAVQGVYSMLAQLYLFPYALRRWGALRTYRTTIIIWPLLYVVVPYLVFLPPQFRTTGIMFCLIWRITAQTVSFPMIPVLLKNSAPSMQVLGMINGVAASAASLSRAFGPTLSGSLFSFGQSIGCVGLAFWFTAFIALLGAIQSFWMTEEDNIPEEDTKAVDVVEEA